MVEDLLPQLNGNRGVLTSTCDDDWALGGGRAAAAVGLRLLSAAAEGKGSSEIAGAKKILQGPRVQV